MGGGGGIVGAIKGYVSGGVKSRTGGMVNLDNGFKVGAPNPEAMLEGLTQGPESLGKALGLGGGGGGEDAAMANAMIEQARASVQAADISAGAARYQADQTLQGMKLQTNASIKSSQNAALGGVLGAALGANTTHEEIKQWLPHEAGAATIASWDLAQKWNKTLDMRTAGYNDTAINYELSGKRGSSLFNDAQWNALKMAEMTKKDLMASVQTFGIKSPSNPTGISIAPNEWEELHSMKDPQAMLQVDPAVAAARNAEFSAWEKKMRAEGKGIIVDMYKNPQLAGSNILSMKGKDPLLDPALAPMLGTLMGGNPASPSGVKPPTGMGMFGPKGGTSGNTGTFGPNSPKGGTSGNTGKVGLNSLMIHSDIYKTGPNGGTSGNTGTFGPNSPKGGTSDNTDWNAAIRALTQGEKNPMTDQIKWAMQNGIVDKYGMVSAGALQKFIPPSLMEAPEFNPMRPLTDQQKIQLQDQYKQMTEVKVDPKLIREETLGAGVTRKTKLNPDGTVAATTMEGYMTDMTGNTHFVSVGGNRLQDWYDRQSMIDGKGPTFPGMRAPVTQAEQNGARPRDNMMATQNNGSKGTTGQNSNTAPIKSNVSGPQLAAPKAPTNNANPAAAVGGAPLAAGG